MPQENPESPPLQQEFNLFNEHDEPAEIPTGVNGGDLQLLFTGGNAPVLESITSFLAKDWDGDGVLDLSDHLIIVPTRNAGRRLREALAVFAAGKGGAVFPPLVTTPDFLTSPDRLPHSSAPTIDRETTRLVWAATLLDIDLRSFPRLFPAEPVTRDLAWAMKNAGEILDVRHLLVESGLSFAAATPVLQDREMEPARWDELTRLERLAVEKIKSIGLRDEADARLEASNSGTLPPEIKQVLVAATPDLPGIARTALGLHPTTILVHADESASSYFDNFGRPLPSHWLEAGIEIPDPESSIRDAATPSAQAELACELIGESSSPAALIAIGVPDSEVVSPMEQSAIARGWNTHDPAGLPVSRHGVHYLLARTGDLLSSRSFDAVTRLFRCPDIGSALARHLQEEEKIEVRTSQVLRGLDDLREYCLPDRLDDAIAGAKRNSGEKRKFAKRPEIEASLKWIDRWLKNFQKKNFGETLGAYLAEIFANRRFTPSEASHGAFPEVASAILEAERALRLTSSAFPNKITPAERFQLLLELIRERKLYDEREPDDIDLQGWLELLWEDAPHLVVTGMNDHVVPEAIIGHAFLPDSARRVLGIPNNDDRFSRDAYLLDSLIRTRKDRGGRVDLIFGRQSESGDPLRPSRLLFQCPDEELPRRTLQFFNGETPARTPLPWQLPWQLKLSPLPEDSRVFQRLSVTQFRSYLTCPFRFYLSHGLGMNEVDSEKSEMEARDFGNLLHDALEQYGRDPEAAQSADAKEITDFLKSKVDAILYQKYGSNLTTPVLIQREAAHQRLGWWAKIEAAERADGWRILEPEISISTDEHPFEIAGLPISGRIDRIEQHEDGRLRVFDFKTHSIYNSATRKNKLVAEYHHTAIKRTEDPDQFPEWQKFECDGKTHRWVDLQIPLYLLSLTKRYPDRKIEVGHVALGPTRAEVILDLWLDLDQELLDSAFRCAEGVVEAVQSCTFWPPASRLPWSDPFEEILFGEAKESVDSTQLSQAPNPFESAT
ncbi:PD-(D/E)XK nuclease family protein [Verrucomicrobiales bacterium]|nr:PD-(D/E)XK nuclease family protein [Verrucomicrobiales bacterium]MDC3352519.1 PD-(D/E)XK nuclease family protein [Verrucomicrobiales bacterium]